MTVGLGSLFSPERFEAERSARVEIVLHNLRFIPYGDARSLIYQIAFFTASFKTEDADACRAKASASAAEALGAYLWETVREPLTPQP
ncbi:hypothetical protein QA646_19855 (plasmid) [Rhizobium sp. CB3090]|uniref:hypothetical protein n=1 Tax=Rhizobium sp. CB3090 TaxID=3039156 RepID=UPI0024B252CB|nr:hypothetical protein [Rhizobium sp. CB3090]WFU12187.1 hypothetical protein QA646_19855 [Rhizobium sp. CB3090]